eukprot:556839-Pleurochrysis_carterae.AAC.2
MHSSSTNWICAACVLAERSRSAPQVLITVRAWSPPSRLRPRQRPPRRRAPIPAPAHAPDPRLFVSYISTSFPARSGW